MKFIFILHLLFISNLFSQVAVQTQIANLTTLSVLIDPNSDEIYKQDEIITGSIETVVSVGQDQDSGTRVLTVGYGTFTIILSIMIQLLMTFFCGRSTRMPEQLLTQIYQLFPLFRLIFFVTLLIPMSVAIFFIYAPKEAEKQIRESDDFPSNPYLILQVFAIIIAVLAFLIAGIMLLAITFFKGLKAIRISSQLEMERDKSKADRQKEKEKNPDENQYDKFNQPNQTDLEIKQNGVF